MSPGCKTSLLCLALPVLLSCANSLILRLPCQTEALFTVTMVGKYLQNALLLSLPNANVIECVQSCVRHPKCKSINMKKDRTGCELNSMYHGMIGVSMLSNSNWTYLSTDYQAVKIGLQCRSASFCPPNVLCKDTCVPPYFECVRCNEFYEGLHCDRRKDIDECLYSPCKNNGTCTDLTRDYACNCTSGFTGKSCETDINECSSYPCQYDGDCVDAVNGYKCMCLSGTTGERCEININECASSPCQNGGTCTDGINKYQCTCAAGYNGTHCEQDINECASSPCQNGGRCINVVNGYYCLCLPNFKGKNCAKYRSED